MKRNAGRKVAVIAASVALVGTALAPAQAAAAKNASASWTGAAGQTVTIGNRTGSCNGCTRYTLTRISGDGDLSFDVHYKRAVSPDGKRYLVTTMSTTSATAGVWVYALTFKPGKQGRPTFTTTWTLTFQGPPQLSLPDQSYWLSQSGGNMTLQDIKVRTNSRGARSYSVLDSDNTAGCTLPHAESTLHFARTGHCKVRVSLAADGIYTPASVVATINVMRTYTYNVTVYGWVQKTHYTGNDLALSRARANAVRRYLLSQGVHVSKFRVVQGKGAKSRANAARQATVNIAWAGVTTGSRTTTVYFAPMSSHLTTFAQGRLKVLWRQVPRE
jgi:hypothetical protein